MNTASYYQNLASQVGYITNPLEFNGMFFNQDPEQQKLQQQAQNIKQYNDFVQKTKDDVSNYEKEGKYNPQLMPAVQANKQYQFSNGAPIMQKGTTVMQQGEDVYDVPMALAQLMAYEQGTNGGRVNVMDKYFSNRGPKGNDYADNTVKKQYLRLIGDLPQFSGTGAVNDYLNYEQKVKQIGNQYQDPNDPNKKVDLNYAKESLNAQGQGVTGKTGNQQIAQEIGALSKPSLNRAAAMGRERDERIQLGQILKDLQNMAATTANVPVKENLVHYGNLK